MDPKNVRRPIGIATIILPHLEIPRNGDVRPFRSVGSVGLLRCWSQRLTLPASSLLVQSQSEWAASQGNKASIDAGVPVLIHCGLTGIGQGQPGGKGILLDNGHPRHIDAVAARFPELRILAARPAYPWQDEMIAILLHKGNVHYELHGWSPRTLPPQLVREIGGRMQDRIMFGCDYPVLKFEMMIDRWQGLGLGDEVLEKVFYRNAEAYFPGATMDS